MAPVSAEWIRPPTPARPAPEGVENPARLTHQLLRHLAGLPRLLPGELATRSYTQAGMAARLGAGQSAVSRILRRLVAAGVVTAETRHIRDGDRRVRVYLLTDRGERLGRALREMPKTPEMGEDGPSGST
jgi:DNA-binding MarR family transcriptional regulator